MPFKTEPVSGSFLLAGIFGFAFSVLYWKAGKLPASWGFTFLLLSVIFIVASLLSLRQSIEIEHKTKSAPHHKRRKKK